MLLPFRPFPRSPPSACSFSTRRCYCRFLSVTLATTSDFAYQYSFLYNSVASAGTEAKAAEMTVFDVKLDKFNAASKIKVIKEVRGFTELGLKEAKDLVEKAPVVVKKGVSKEEGDSPDSVLSSDSSLKIPWTFDSGTEKMYLLKGKVNIYCDEQDDEPFQIAAGDLVEFPNAMQIVFETRDLVVSYSIPNVVTCGNVPLESSFQKVPRIRQFFLGPL